jgi:hypothetical protein
MLGISDMRTVWKKNTSQDFSGVRPSGFGALGSKRATREFGEDEVQDACNYVIGEVQPFAADIPIDLRPDCFAVPRNH